MKLTQEQLDLQAWHRVHENLLEEYNDPKLKRFKRKIARQIAQVQSLIAKLQKQLDK